MCVCVRERLSIKCEDFNVFKINLIFYKKILYYLLCKTNPFNTCNHFYNYKQQIKILEINLINDK